MKASLECIKKENESMTCSHKKQGTCTCEELRYRWMETQNVLVLCFFSVTQKIIVKLGMGQVKERGQCGKLPLEDRRCNKI